MTRQELTARDFSPDEGFKSDGALYVLPTFKIAQPGKRIRYSAEAD